MPGWKRRTGIMLAYPFEKGRIERNFHLPIILQPKLNGERCRVLIKSGKVHLVSSEGNVINSVPHIYKDFEELVKRGVCDIELDGELYAHGLPLQKIHSLVSRKVNIVDSEVIQFHCFDLVSESLSQFDRLSLLFSELWKLIKDLPSISLVPTHQVTTLGEIEEKLLHYMSQNYEGIILRDPLAKYVRRRTTTMLKWKPRKQDCYLIVGTKEEIDKDGFPKGTLGAIICESDGEQFSVGTGSYFTRERRQELWEIRDSLPGKYAVVKYQELTERKVPSHPVCINISTAFEEFDDE